MQPIKLGLALVLETIIALPVTAYQEPVWQSPSRQTRFSGIAAICRQSQVLNYTTRSYKLPFKGSVRLRQKYCLGENLQFATGTFRDAGGDRLCTGSFRLLRLQGKDRFLAVWEVTPAGSYNCATVGRTLALELRKR